MATFVSENFDGHSGGTNLDTLAGWSKRSAEPGNVLLSAAGRAYAGSASYLLTCYLSSGSPAGAEYDVEATFRSLDDYSARDNYPTIVGRADAASRAFYGLQYRTSAGAWHLVRMEPDAAGGSAGVSLGSYSQSLTTGVDYAVKLEIRDGAKKVYIDGVERISSADNTLTAAGKAGLFFLDEAAGTSTTGIHLDDFTAADPVAADSTPPTAGTWATNTAGTQITGTLSESGCVPASGTGGFSLGGTSAAVSGWAISGTDITLTLSPAIQYGETVVIGYDRAATTDDIADAAGNFLANFTAASVTNNVPAPALAAGVASFGADSFSGPGGIKVQATAPTGGTGAGPTYQWERNEDGGAYADVTGATTLTPFDATATTPGVLYGYRCKQTRGSDTVTTNTITAEVYEGGALTAPPPGEVDDVTAQEIIDAIVADVRAGILALARKDATLPDWGTGAWGTYDESTDSLEAADEATVAAMGDIPTAAENATAVRTELTTELGRIDVATSTRLATAGYTAAPTAAQNATQVRTELTTELGRLDAAVSTRLATGGYTAPLDAAGTRAAIGLATDTDLTDRLDAIQAAADAAGGSDAAYSSTLATVTSTGGTFATPLPTPSLVGHILWVGGRGYEIATHTAGAAAFTVLGGWLTGTTPSTGATVEAQYVAPPDPTVPSGVATTYRGRMMQVWARLMGKVVKDFDADAGAGTIKVMSGATTLTTQNISVSGNVETQQAAS